MTILYRFYIGDLIARTGQTIIAPRILSGLGQPSDQLARDGSHSGCRTTGKVIVYA
jgi:hypothetical protein